MSSEHYREGKSASWKEIIFCTVIWLLIVVSFFMLDVAVFDKSGPETAAVPADTNRLTQNWSQQR